MVNKETLKRIIVQQKNIRFKIEETIEREILDEVLKWFKDNRILILTGIRRAGKSTLLRQIMYKKSDYCYVNFDNEAFINFKAEEFEMLNETLIEVYGNPSIYFFDEIQNIDKFETFVRRLHDEGKKVIITGSNATLLSSELGTRLTGRYKAFEVFPFSFREFLKFNKVHIKKEDIFLSDKKVQIIKSFKKYLNLGGMPEYLIMKDEDYIRTIYENILYRDIISRYTIRRQKVLKELVEILTNNICSTITYNSLKNKLGLSNSITVKEYISYLNNSYLFFELQKLEYSIRKQLNSPKKIYLIDPAFSKIGGFNFSMNKGRILENIAFIELKRQKKEIFYYSDKNGCDFVIKKGTKVIETIQVCYNMNEKNKEREIKGLIEAMEKFNLKKGLILTYDQEEKDIKIKEKVIEIKPLWKLLLERK